MSTHTGCPSCASLGAAIKEPAPVPGKLTHWPIQIKLIGTVAPFLKDADVLVAADCTAFAAGDLYKETMVGRKVLIGCPKLDNGMEYVDKFTELLNTNNFKSLTVLRMEVPCCGGMTAILREAIKRSGKQVPFTEIVVGVKGDKLSEQQVPV